MTHGLRARHGPAPRLDLSGYMLAAARGACNGRSRLATAYRREAHLRVTTSPDPPGELRCGSWRNADCSGQRKQRLLGASSGGEVSKQGLVQNMSHPALPSRPVQTKRCKSPAADTCRASTARRVQPPRAIPWAAPAILKLQRVHGQ